jgi:transposase-like protein
MNRIPIALFSSREQALPIQQRLVQAGIVAEIHEELGLQRLWFVSKQAAGARLEVLASQVEWAEKLLAAWDGADDGALAKAIRCPECKSLRVDYPQFAHNSVMTNVAAGIVAELGLVEKDYYCEHCHYTWPKSESTPIRHRSHLAPNYFIEDIEPAAASPGARQKQQAGTSHKAA